MQNAERDYRNRLIAGGTDPDTAAEVAHRYFQLNQPTKRKARTPPTKGENTKKRQPKEPEASKGDTPNPQSGSAIRATPKDDAQHDFFVPSLYDVSGRDSRSLMDVAVFRLSKRAKRAGEIIRHELPDGYVEVSAGAYGMASIWDYDIVLMMVSQLTESMNRYRDGKGEKPGRIFQPHVADILKFCRKNNGARQYQEIHSALDRLQGTQIKFIRKSGGKEMQTSSVGLIDSYDILSRTDTGKVSSVKIGVPSWIYEEVTNAKRPDILAVHPDYFLIEPGIARFIYRVCRRAAGKGNAFWSFRMLYERSGSTGAFKKFCWTVRKLIAANELPEYALQEQEGREGPILVMTNREAETESAPQD